MRCVGSTLRRGVLQQQSLLGLKLLPAPLRSEVLSGAVAVFSWYRSLRPSHDEVVLMQSMDLLGLQVDRHIAPTEADIRMMAFRLLKFTNLLNKRQRFPKIAKPESPLDVVSFLW